MDEGYSISSDEGPRSNPRRDNSKIAKLYLFNFSRTTGPILIKLGTKQPWVKRTQVFKNKEHLKLKKKIYFSLFINVMV